MTRTMSSIAPMLSIVLFVSQQGNPAAGAPRKPPGVQAQWAKLSAEFYAAKTSLEAEREKASEKRKAEIAQKIFSLPQEYAPRFLEFAKSNLGNENAFDPLFWIAIELREGKLFDEAMVLLKENFATNQGIPNLWMLLPELLDSPSDQVNPFLRRRAKGVGSL